MQLTKRHEAVDTYENQTGKMDLIFKATTPDKKNFRLDNKTLLVMDLRDSSNNKLDPSTIVEFAGRKPTQRFPQEIDEKSYRPYNQIDMENQYNTENQGQLLIKLNSAYIDFIEGHQIEIHVDSPDVVDWDNSEIEFEVVEEPYREPQGR